MNSGHSPPKSQHLGNPFLMNNVINMSNGQAQMANIKLQAAIGNMQIAICHKP